MSKWAECFGYLPDRTCSTDGRENVVRQYMIIAAMGFVLLFVSSQCSLSSSWTRFCLLFWIGFVYDINRNLFFDDFCFYNWWQTLHFRYEWLCVKVQKVLGSIWGM